MVQKQTGMFYNGSLEIGLNELAGINTALLTACDFLYINANYMVTQADYESYEHIRGVMDAYIGEGLIRLWDYPGRCQSDRVTVLPPQDYMHWNKIVGANQHGEQMKRLDDYLEQSSAFLERSSMLVDLKKEYWHYAICNMLKADQIMFTQLSKQIEAELSQLDMYRYAGRQEPLVRRIFSLTQVNTQGLALLTAPEMKRQIRNSQDFRSYISQIQNESGDDSEYFQRELIEFMRDVCGQYARHMQTAPQSILGHGLNIAAFCPLPGVSFAAGVIATAKGAFDDITTRTHDKRSLLHFTTRLAKLTNKAEKKWRR